MLYWILVLEVDSYAFALLPPAQNNYKQEERRKMRGGGRVGVDVSQKCIYGIAKRRNLLTSPHPPHQSHLTETSQNLTETSPHLSFKKKKREREREKKREQTFASGRGGLGGGLAALALRVAGELGADPRSLVGGLFLGGGGGGRGLSR